MIADEELYRELHKTYAASEIRKMLGWDDRRYKNAYNRVLKKEKREEALRGMDIEEYKLVKEDPCEKNHYMHAIRETLCFSCRRCNADMCRWFHVHNPKPVDGWDAIPRELTISGRRTNKRTVKTYDVRHCPNFVPDARADDRRVRENERWMDEQEKYKKRGAKTEKTQEM